MTAPRQVIGCVWGAHRAVVEMFANASRVQQREIEAPTYEWCEQQWRAGLSKRAPAPAALPDWLRQELWAAWRRHLAERRRESVQLELWGAA